MDTKSEPRTLGEFIEQHLANEKKSARQLADELGVNHRMINEYRQHGLNPDIGNPRREFLVLLAKTTGTNPLILFALTFGLADDLQKLQNLPPTALSRAEKIEELPANLRDIIDGIIDRGNKKNNDV